MLVGETIVGVIQDDEGRWYLVVKSGHALVLSNGAFWTATPGDVRRVIDKRHADLTAIKNRLVDLTAVENMIP